ncbi:MAG: ribonuclease PH [Eubacteriaceae bacterium]|nr:ribonuclease PH [Eubacteriaceae bacterium]
MERANGRKENQLRDITISVDVLKNPHGSALIRWGDNIVLCTAFVEESVPPFQKGSGSGWITAEYSMLPASNNTRRMRDISKLRLDGRSSEIQRLIGRSLRSIADLELLGERSIWVDCDVLQADGGTRCASITGGVVAVYSAMQKLLEKKVIEENPIRSFAAAVSVGVGEDSSLLVDLDYLEDSAALVDMNLVMDEDFGTIEIQGTGEKRPITPVEMAAMVELAKNAIANLIEIQKRSLGIGL